MKYFGNKSGALAGIEYAMHVFDKAVKTYGEKYLYQQIYQQLFRLGQIAVARLALQNASKCPYLRALPVSQLRIIRLTSAKPPSSLTRIHAEPLILPPASEKVMLVLLAADQKTGALEKFS